MDTETKVKHHKYSWVLSGLFWSAMMILFMGIGEPLYNNEPITAKSLFHEAIIWMPAGLLFGLLNRYLNKRQEKKDNRT